MSERPLRIGILGGGQLGRLLVEAAPELDRSVELFALTARADDPVSQTSAHVTVGDVHAAEDVIAFGRALDVVTVDREDVSADGLRQLERLGVAVWPKAEAIATIQDKGSQKEALVAHGHPTSPFALFDDAAALRRAVAEGRRALPFVQKTRRMGFDGRGVQVVRCEADLASLLDVPCLAEDLVDIAHELAVVVARDRHGRLARFDPVEMVFHPEANLLEWLVCPARVPGAVREAAQDLAAQVAVDLDVVGLLAVEMFVDRTGHLWVNEMAPRPHNSGHHTIEAAATSQYAQLLRVLVDAPLGPTTLRRPAVLLNLLGAEGAHGVPEVRGLERWRHRDDVAVHLYGKTEVRPFRKMGHVTVLADDLDAAFALAEQVRRELVVTGR